MSSGLAASDKCQAWESVCNPQRSGGSGEMGTCHLMEANSLLAQGISLGWLGCEQVGVYHCLPHFLIFISAIKDCFQGM